MQILFILLIFTLIYFGARLRFKYWQKRGVKGPKPSFFIGNIGDNLRMKKHLGEIITDIYREYENEPYVGIFKIFEPVLVVRDLELIKHILWKSFNNFELNDFFVDKKNDPLLGQNPFVLIGETWKTVRTEFIRCFTSSKMKALYPLLNQSAKEWIDFIKSNEIDLNAKDLCAKFTLNNVASCAFGIDGECFKDNSEFEKLGNSMVRPGSWTNFIMFLANLFPNLARQVPVKFTPKEVENKLIDIVSANIRSRTENNIVRKDFLNNLIEMNKNHLDDRNTVVNLTAHAANFFDDGYQTSALVMSFLLYHIAANDEVQAKLRHEISECYKNESSFTYETIKEMEYLDACFNESMRLNPVIFHITKICTEDFRYNNLLVEKGTKVAIPVSAIHNDPKYFDQAELFIPERFLTCNREKIIKGSFMPFGDGPRICPGQNFGTLQIKIGVVQLMKNFKLSVNEKTKTPFRYDPTYFLASPSEGIWLDLENII